VLVSLPALKWTDIVDAYRVRRSETTLQVEQADAVELFELRGRVHRKEMVRPKDADPVVWWKEQLANLAFAPIQVSTDSPSMVLPETIGYPLIGEASFDDHVKFDAHPPLGPPDTTLLRVRRRRPAGTAHAYWIASDRGYTAVRWEFETENVQKEWIHTNIIDKLEKSPKGRWYATEARQGAVEHSGEEPRTDHGVAPVSTVLWRYLVEFE
jgi:hypothetical protein